MIKLVSFLILFISVSNSWSLVETSWEVEKTSYSNTVDTLVRISSSGPGDLLVGVHISSCGSYPSSLLIYDSSLTATNLIYHINTSSAVSSNSHACPAIGNHMFFTIISSAITILVNGTAAPARTLMWRNRDNQNGP